jgi:hypothetical protein
MRVYYIVRQDVGPGYRLAEMCRTNDGPWIPGALNQNNIACSENTLISANVESGQGDLKIFFMDPNGSPAIAWVVLGQTSWAQHLLTNTW